MTAVYFGVGTAETIFCDLFEILSAPQVTELLYKTEVAHRRWCECRQCITEQLDLSNQISSLTGDFAP